jgi:hypothetical protein
MPALYCPKMLDRKPNEEPVLPVEEEAVEYEAA